MGKQRIFEEELEEKKKTELEGGAVRLKDVRTGIQFIRRLHSYCRRHSGEFALGDREPGKHGRDPPK